jgi:hypothetical protein
MISVCEDSVTYPTRETNADFLLEKIGVMKRDCVNCGTAVPTCPSCPVGYTCTMVALSCNNCAFTKCVEDPSVAASSTPSASATTSSSPNIGAIAGAVIGGVLVIALFTYLIWRFCIKNKRPPYQENWSEYPEDQVSDEKDFAMRRDARASTHTVTSIASTVLTRASNIIQIAYIPGVTNRSTPSTPGPLVPPVPPIPVALTSPTDSAGGYEDQHFFMPGDLRDSTYSGMTDRTSYARNSVASTIYGKNAVVSQIPAQTVIRGKAAVVSVKSSGANTPGDLTPPVPSVDFDKYKTRGPPSPAFSVGSTFLNSATSATQVKPQVVRVISGKSKSSHSREYDEDSEKSLLGRERESTAITIIDDTPAIEQGPFSDLSLDSHKRNGSLSAVIEEAAKKAHSNGKISVELKEGTPFGDEHATND